MSADILALDGKPQTKVDGTAKILGPTKDILVAQRSDSGSHKWESFSKLAPILAVRSPSQRFDKEKRKRLDGR
jgi:hypothetical protein